MCIEVLFSYLNLFKCSYVLIGTQFTNLFLQWELEIYGGQLTVTVTEVNRLNQDKV